MSDCESLGGIECSDKLLNADEVIPTNYGMSIKRSLLFRINSSLK